MHEEVATRISCDKLHDCIKDKLSPDEAARLLFDKTRVVTNVTTDIERRSRKCVDQIAKLTAHEVVQGPQLQFDIGQRLSGSGGISGYGIQLFRVEDRTEHIG